MNKQWDASNEETEEKKWVEKCQSFFVLALSAKRKKVFSDFYKVTTKRLHR